ncbi:MAG TPA: PAS domain S-box protein [Candidatus Binataceae bacterium]|nr:PAS domain S-box protein [Candidatus Binataceae bacterium]
MKPEGSPLDLLAQLLRQAIDEQINEGVVVLRADGTIVYSNRGFARRVAATPAQLLGTAFTRFLSNEQSAAFAALANSDAPGSTGRFRLQAEGEQPVEVILAARSFTADDSARVVVLSVDSFEGQRSHELLNTWMRGMPNVILIGWNRDLEITMAIGQALSAVGVAPEQLIGKPLFALEAHLTPLTANQREDVLAGRPISRTGVYGGHTFDTRIVPLRDSEGEIVGGVAGGVDVTERVVIEQRLERKVAQESALSHFARRALEGGDIQALAHEAVLGVTRALNVPTCVLYEVEADQSALTIRAGVGLAGDAKVGEKLPLSAVPVAQRVVVTGAPVIARNLDSSELSSPWVTVFGRRSALSVPVPRRERLYGVLSVFGHGEADFSAEELEFVRTIASIYAQAVERREVEAQLRHSQQYYRSLLENVSDVISVLEPDGTLLFTNRAATGVFGRNIASIIGTNVLNFHHPDNVEAVRQCYALALQNPEQLRTVESRIRHEDGSWRDSEVAVLATTSLEGRPVLVSTVRDISERKRVERELSLLASIIEFSDEAITSRDTEGRVTSWNPAAERLYGFKAEEIIGKRRDFFEMPELSQQLREAGVRIMQSGRSERLESKRNRKDGSVIEVTVTLSPLLGSNGEVLGIGAISRDASERRLAERARELARSNAELEQFTYAVAHDLKEPMRQMAIYAQLLRRHAAAPQSVRTEYLNRIEEGARHGRELINAVLDYVHLAPQAAELVAVDCEALVKSVVEGFATSIARLQAQVIWDGLPTVMADQALLARVFQNLIGNGLKFHGEQPPQIRITARHDLTEWVFSVHDNGIGIDPQYGRQIFDMFQRLNHRQSYEGTGIGLAICRKALEKLGGRIWLDSECTQGATFRFTLPA